jgi:putative ABC transport system substrate-binding protein
MRRRQFIGLVGGVALTRARFAHAQDRLRRIGVLMGYAEDDSEGQARSTAFLDGLQKLGWTQGRNIRVDIRWAASEENGATQFAKELVAFQPDLIFSNNTLTTAALLKQTRSIPIVFGGISDPISSGFVENFRRPGGNVTGFINTESQLVS